MPLRPLQALVEDGPRRGLHPCRLGAERGERLSGLGGLLMGLGLLRGRGLKGGLAEGGRGVKLGNLYPTTGRWIVLQGVILWRMI